MAQRPAETFWEPPIFSLWLSGPTAEVPVPTELIHTLPAKAATASLFQKKKRKLEAHLIYFYCIRSVIDLETQWRKRKQKVSMIWR